jgi:hypothetical protein
MESEIKLIQFPIIQQNLIEVGKDVANRISDLNLDNQVATIETVSALKSLRANLNKEFSEFENQRKCVKENILNPYQEFENLYKVEVSDKYRDAINLLKDKIATVEDKIKSEKRENIKTYFSELCVSENIDFIEFERLGIDINLSTSEKKYKDQVNEFIKRITNDLSLIDTQPFKAEILVMYKDTLDASLSIKTIQDRKERERIEIERMKLAEYARRDKLLSERSFHLNDFTKTFEYSEDVYITEHEVKELSKEEFSKRLLNMEQLILSTKIEVAVPVEKKEEAAQRRDPIHPSNPAVAIPIQAPKVEEKEETFCASFEIQGTMKQLRGVGAYLKENNIPYKNI